MWHLLITIEDAEGHKATMEEQLASAATYAQANAVGVAIAAAVLPLIDGRITKVQVAEDLGLPAGNPADPDGMSEVEIKGAFSFRTSGGFVYRSSVPTFKRSDFVLPNSDNIDTDDVNVNAFVEAFTQGVTVSGTPVFPRDSRGETLTALISAKEAWGKKRKSK